MGIVENDGLWLEFVSERTERLIKRLVSRDTERLAGLKAIVRKGFVDPQRRLKAQSMGLPLRLFYQIDSSAGVNNVFKALIEEALGY